MPSPQNLSNPAGSYEASYTLEGEVLVVRRRLVLNQDVFQPDEYPAFRELILRLLQDQRTPLVLSR